MSSVVFTGAENQTEVSSSSAEVHVLPCRLQYSGPANVSCYFLREKQVNESEDEYATFRGHWMHGVNFKLGESDNLNIFIAEERSLKKGSKRVFAVQHKLDSLCIWEDETVNPSTHPIFRATNHLKLAEALGVESDSDENDEPIPGNKKP